MKKTEIKIPKGCKATMYQDGDKIIVEYEEKKKFKNGDFLIIDESEDHKRSLLIYDGKKIFLHSYHALLMRDILYLTPSNGVDISNARGMTESERQELLEALHKIGKDWDAEKLQIVDYEWKPKYGETYYIPNPCALTMYNAVAYNGDDFDRRCIERGVSYKTREEAIERAKQMLGIQ